MYEIAEKKVGGKKKCPKRDSNLRIQIGTAWESLSLTIMQTIWTVAQLWLLCFDMDIFANTGSKLKLKNLEILRARYFLLYLLVFELIFVHSMPWS